MSIYDGEQHQSFSFKATEPGGAGALLIHGYTGTPAEMRALGHALANAGIDARAPLLPGFGPDFEHLADTEADDWLATARSAWSEVEQAYAVPLLVGFSMGGALALQLAAEKPPYKLVLLAPFWKIADRRAALLPLLQHVKSEINPFESNDFDAPEIRESFAKADPTLDLDDPAVRESLRRQSTLPTSSLVELQKVGKAGAEAARSISCETLVIQGQEDETVLPDGTRDLVTRIPGAVRLFEVPADHLLVWDDRPAWPVVRDTVVEFLTGRERG